MRPYMSEIKVADLLPQSSAKLFPWHLSVAAISGPITNGTCCITASHATSILRERAISMQGSVQTSGRQKPHVGFASPDVAQVSIAASD